LAPVLEGWLDEHVATAALHAPWDAALEALAAALVARDTAASATADGTTCDTGATANSLVLRDVSLSVEVPREAADIARLIAGVASALQQWISGRAVECQFQWLAEESVHRLVMPYDDERIGRSCLDWAVEFCQMIVSGAGTSTAPVTEFAATADLPSASGASEGATAAAVPAGAASSLANRLAERLAELREGCASRQQLPGLAAILQAAANRGVPVFRTPADDVWQLGWGVRQHRLHGKLTQRGHTIADSFLHDPNVTWKMLQAAGVPMFDPDEDARPANVRVLVLHHRWVAAIQAIAPPVADGAAGGGPTSMQYEELTGAVSADLVTQLVEGTRMLGLELAEFAIKMPDLSAPLDGEERAVVTVSANPDLATFCGVSPELSRRVGEAILEGLFPNHQSGRIPVISITGTNGKTTTTRLCAHIVAQTGKRVGMTCTDGIYIAGRRIDTDDCSGPRSARNVLMNPSVDAAVLETARGGILREGLAFDRCDVAVVTNIGEGDHLGLNGVHNKVQLSRVKRTIVDAVGPQGTAVLKADDPLTEAMAAHCRGSVVFFALDGEHPVMVRHRQQGQRVVFVRDHFVVLAEGELEFPILSLDRIPLTHGGRILFQVENVLASTAANWALGIPAEVIRNGLETFAASVDKSPGRFNLLELNGATVVVDYGHNTSSLQAMLQTLSMFPHPRRLAVYSAAGDRRDADMIQQGQMLGKAFDEVILYEDQYLRGREPGEIMKLFDQGLREGGRVQNMRSVQGWAKAVELILELIQPGNLVLLQADTIDEAVNVVKQLMSSSNSTREIQLKDAVRGSTRSSRV
jgi:cyanophycin synthetase